MSCARVERSMRVTWLVNRNECTAATQRRLKSITEAIHDPLEGLHHVASSRRLSRLCRTKWVLSLLAPLRVSWAQPRPTRQARYRFHAGRPSRTDHTRRVFRAAPDRAREVVLVHSVVAARRAWI